MSANNGSHKTFPRTVAAALDARLTPFHLREGGLDDSHVRLDDLDVEMARAVAPQRDRQLKLRLVNDLKLLFAALGAGGSAVPLGENGRTARLLSNYAASLRDH
jgi:hypothetical protein